jgi:hypothetical protein
VPSPRTCRECGAAFTARRASVDFCSAACRGALNNRRLKRGGQLYDLVMAWRFDRTAAAASGAQSLLCRMAAAFKAEDDRDRAGRPSWDDVARVRERNSHLVATVVGTNVAGNRRISAAK